MNKKEVQKSTGKRRIKIIIIRGTVDQRSYSNKQNKKETRNGPGAN